MTRSDKSATHYLHLRERPGGRLNTAAAINPKDLQSRYRVSLETDVFFLDKSP
jgi:hypothetical protein